MFAQLSIWLGVLGVCGVIGFVAGLAWGWLQKALNSVIET